MKVVAEPGASMGPKFLISKLFGKKWEYLSPLPSCGKSWISPAKSFLTTNSTQVANRYNFYTVWNRINFDRFQVNCTSLHIVNLMNCLTFVCVFVLFCVKKITQLLMRPVLLRNQTSTCYRYMYISCLKSIIN